MFLLLLRLYRGNVVSDINPETVRIVEDSDLRKKGGSWKMSGPKCPELSGKCQELIGNRAVKI